MKLVPFGDAAYRIDLEPDTDRAALQRALLAHPGVTDALVTDRHALVIFDPARPPESLQTAWERLGTISASTPRMHVVRARYDGADLAEVAGTLGITPADVVALHAREYEVQLVGFLPGFAYLGPLASPLDRIPRRATPRPRVPALAIAVAAGRTGIYPFASPGGWQLIGTAVDFTPLDRARGPVFRLGDRVRFEPA